MFIGYLLSFFLSFFVNAVSANQVEQYRKLEDYINKSIADNKGLLIKYTGKKTHPLSKHPLFKTFFFKDRLNKKLLIKYVGKNTAKISNKLDYYLEKIFNLVREILTKDKDENKQNLDQELEIVLIIENVWSQRTLYGTFILVEDKVEDKKK